MSCSCIGGTCSGGSCGGYSGNAYDVDSATQNGVIYPSLDPSIFELKFPGADIEGRVVGDSSGGN